MSFVYPSGIGWGTDVYRAVFYPLTKQTGGIAAPGTPAATDPYEGLTFNGPKNLSLNMGAPRTLNNVSQGRVNDTIYLPSLDAKTAEFHLSYIDQATFAALSNVKTRNIGGGKGTPIGTDKQGLELLGTFLVSQLAFHDESGVDQWNNYIFPRVRAIVQWPGMTDAETDVTVNLSLSSTRKHIWGEALSETNDGATQMAAYNHVTWDRFNIVAWLADGVEDTFLLPTDKPALANFADTLSVWNYNTGTEITLDAATSETAAVLTAAPAADVLLIGMYEY